MRHTRLTWRTGQGGDAPPSPLGGAPPDVLMRQTRRTWRTGHGGDAPLSPLGGASPDVLMRQTSSAAAYPGATNPWQHAGAGSTASVASAVMATDRNAPEKDGERGWTWFALRALLVL